MPCLLQPGLAVMVQIYVNAINTPNVIPNVQSAWDTFVAVKCSDAKQAALVTYDALLTSQLTDELPCSNVMIRMRHSDVFDMCQEQFMAEITGFSTNAVERTLSELKVSDSQTSANEFCDQHFGCCSHCCRRKRRKAKSKTSVRPCVLLRTLGLETTPIEIRT